MGGSLGRDYGSSCVHAQGGGARRHIMIWTVAIILLILWILGLVSSYTMGGFIHLLLLAALVAVVFQLFQGRKLTSR